MSRRSLPPIIAAAVLAVAGCEKARPTVPVVDYSQSIGYAVVPFKDDAPANANPNPAEFPHAFVDHLGNPVDLTQYHGKKKVVLVVLRGMPRSERSSFCPSCLAQTGSLMANQAEFSRRGAEILVVFPGPSDRVGEFLQKVKVQTPGEPARVFQVLLDRECRACDRLGIRDDLAKPSTYILDTAGKLVYAYVGETSTDRPSVKAVLTQLDQAP
jgi:peroxiredoxin Q/BCP